VDFVHPIEAVIPGARGRILAVLVHTTAEVNLRTLARLAGVSLAQASRVVPALVELGLVERREVGSASQFRLVRDHIAARAIVELADARETLLAEMGWIAAELPVPPVSVVAFGSFARGEAWHGSDLDVVFVRPDGVEEDDDLWADSVESWRRDVRALSGNPVEVLEVAMDDLPPRLNGAQPLWQAIRSEGVVVHGPALTDLATDSDG
jgi:DNA-binding transcriptional ArsR family regulator